MAKCKGCGQKIIWIMSPGESEGSGMTDYKKLVEALRFETDYVAVEKTMRDAAASIEALQAQLPKRGKWIYKPKDAIEMMFTLPKCSVCGHESSDANNYCPNCGAKMEDNNG